MPDVILRKPVRIGGNYTKAELSAADFQGTGDPLVLKQGQIAIEKDTRKGKWGDGITEYADLEYVFFDGDLPGGQVEVPITANPFTYDTGITGKIPQIRTMLKVGDAYTPYGSYTFDKITGIVSTDVYTGSEDYVLVIG